METLSEAVAIPKIPATLVAYFEPPRGKERVATWRMDLRFPPSDARYAGAEAVLWPSGSGNTRHLDVFISEMSDALRKMEALQQAQFRGEYRKSIGTPTYHELYPDPALVVVAEEGRISPEVSARSHTYNRFHFLLHIDEVVEAIDILKDVPARAVGLVKTLESLP